MSKKVKNKKNTGKIILLIILALMIFLGSLLGYSIYKNGGGLQGFLATILGQNVEKLENLDTLNVLILGVSEDLGSKLTDTIMVCSYNPKTQKASMLSVPRDTFIGQNKSKAKGKDKLNAVYANSGPAKAVEKVEEITGMDIPYYAMVNNQVVIDLVNDIGGVYFDVPIDMKYDDITQDLHINLKAGYQKIDGDHAEQLLRFRHNNNGTSYPADYGDNDFGRMRTQREFTTEVVKQTLKIQNITRIKSIMTTIFKNVDTNLKLDDLYPYIPYAVSFDTTNISSQQVAGESQQCNKLWFFIHNKEQTSKIITEMTNYLQDIETNGNTTNTTNSTKTTSTTSTKKKAK